jgi:hypothetical protein
MVKCLSRPGDDKCLDKKGEIWERYQEIKDRRKDNRSHLTPGETIATVYSQPVSASASLKVSTGAVNAESSNNDAPTPVLMKRRNQNRKQKAV